MTGVSAELVALLQERHDLRQQVDMRKIAVDQLLIERTTSSGRQTADPPPPAPPAPRTDVRPPA